MYNGNNNNVFRNYGHVCRTHSRGRCSNNNNNNYNKTNNNTQVPLWCLFQLSAFEDDQELKTKQKKKQKKNIYIQTKHNNKYDAHFQLYFAKWLRTAQYLYIFIH